MAFLQVALVVAGRMAGKKAVIVGVGRGIGVATAVMAADSGAEVAVVARSAERLEGVARLIRERGGVAHPIVGDVAEAQQAARVAEQAGSLLGGAPDVLVNAVGAWRASDLLAEDPANVRAMLDGNLATIMHTTPVFARAMKDEGKRGAIVNVGAVYGALIVRRGQAAYNAAKAGVVAYTRSAAADLLPHGIRVNCVLPGATSHKYAPDRDLATLRTLGKDQVGAPGDVATAILFLASDEAAWITGAALAVDGGDSLR